MRFFLEQHNLLAFHQRNASNYDRPHPSNERQATSMVQGEGQALDMQGIVSVAASAAGQAGANVSFTIIGSQITNNIGTQIQNQTVKTSNMTTNNENAASDRSTFSSDSNTNANTGSNTKASDSTSSDTSNGNANAETGLSTNTWGSTNGNTSECTGSSNMEELIKATVTTTAAATVEGLRPELAAMGDKLGHKIDEVKKNRTLQSAAAFHARGTEENLPNQNVSSASQPT
ncbi:MAG: hypothetical protein SGILL_000187 [Bacillariaceae sp.]